MQGAYGGLIVIIMYAVNATDIDEEFALLTEDNRFILTETSQNILEG